MQGQNYDLTVEIVGMSTSQGNIHISIYNSEESFLTTPYQSTIRVQENQVAKAVFTELPPGTYAVSSFHDLNDDGKLNSNFLRIPQEPVGTSNDAKGSFGPPKFKDAKFEIVGNKKISFRIK